MWLNMIWVKGKGSCYFQATILVLSNCLCYGGYRAVLILFCDLAKIEAKLNIASNGVFCTSCMKLRSVCMCGWVNVCAHARACVCGVCEWVFLYMCACLFAYVCICLCLCLIMRFVRILIYYRIKGSKCNTFRDV